MSLQYLSSRIYLNVHAGDARDLPHPFPQVFVAGGHYVAPVLGGPLHQAIVGVRALVGAGQAHEPRVFREPKRHLVHWEWWSGWLLTKKERNKKREDKNTRRHTQR